MCVCVCFKFKLIKNEIIKYPVSCVCVCVCVDFIYDWKIKVFVEVYFSLELCLIYEWEWKWRGKKVAHGALVSPMLWSFSWTHAVDQRPPLPQKCTSVCVFCTCLSLFLSSILDDNNEQGKPTCGSMPPLFIDPGGRRGLIWFSKQLLWRVILWSVLFPWEISDTISIPKYKKRPQNYRSNAKLFGF